MIIAWGKYKSPKTDTTHNHAQLELSNKGCAVKELVFFRTFAKNLGSREDCDVVGFFVFSHTRMMGYFRLG